MVELNLNILRITIRFVVIIIYLKIWNTNEFLKQNILKYKFLLDVSRKRICYINLYET